MKKTIYLTALCIAFFSFTFAQYTAVPDAVFEQRLIDDGIDSNPILDSQILTSEAAAFSGHLSLDGDGISTGIQDLTGLEAFTNVTSIDVSYNINLSSMDLTSNTLLTNVIATGCTLLTSVNVSGLTNLTEMLFRNASLASLDVTSNSGLTDLDIRNNHVTTLDLSNNHVIDHVSLKNNGLTYLDLRNGNQANMVFFDSDSNPNLTCIFFDDASLIDRDAHIVWFIDDLSCLVDNQAECDSCTLSTTNETNLAYNMYPNPAIGSLHVATNLPHAIFSICSITGKVVFIKELNETDNLIDVSSLASGLYLAKISSDNQIDTKKLMIK